MAMSITSTEFALGVGAYLFGAIPAGVLVARCYGVDILQSGSGNPGATNVLRMCGKGAGLLVFFLDMLKGLIPALVGRALIDGEMGPLTLGLLAVLGHSLSPFLRFRGGKGVSTGLGALLGSTPWVALSALAVFLVSLWIWRFVSLSSILAGLAVFSFGWLFGDPLSAVIAYFLLMAFVTIKHISNIKRLIAGTERKFSLKQTPAEPEPEPEPEPKPESEPEPEPAPADPAPTEI